MEKHSGWLVALTGLALALVLFLGIRQVPLTDNDEARFARTSVEMLRRADLVVPTFDGRLRLVKPPLIHWLQMPLFSVFGPVEWAARLHAIAATLGSLVLLVWVVRRRFGGEGAFWAAACFATFPLVVVAGKLATLDALLSVHIFAATALDLAGDEKSDRRSSAAIGALMGLAFLAKGPVGVVLPVLMMSAGRAVSGRRVLPEVGSLLTAVVAVCAVVAPWVLAFVSRVGLTTALETVRHEALDRFLTGHDHPAPLFYFLAIAFPAFGPWIAMSIVAAGRALRRPGDPDSRTAAYACGAWITGLVFFSVGRGKLPSYILPLAPFIAIATSWAIGQTMGPRRRRGFEPMMMAGVLTLMALGLSIVLSTGRWPELHLVTASGAAIFGVGALAAWVGALKQKIRLVFVSVAVASFAFMLVASWIAFPLLGESRSCRSAVRTVPALSSGRPIVIFEQRIPSLTFYADVVPEWVAPAGLAERLDRGDCPFIVFRNKDLAQIPPEALARVRALGRTQQFVIAECRDGA